MPTAPPHFPSHSTAAAPAAGGRQCARRQPAAGNWHGSACRHDVPAPTRSCREEERTRARKRERVESRPAVLLLLLLLLLSVRLLANGRRRRARTQPATAVRVIGTLALALLLQLAGHVVLACDCLCVRCARMQASGFSPSVWPLWPLASGPSACPHDRHATTATTSTSTSTSTSTPAESGTTAGATLLQRVARLHLRLASLLRVLHLCCSPGVSCVVPPSPACPQCARPSSRVRLGRRR